MNVCGHIAGPKAPHLNGERALAMLPGRAERGTAGDTMNLIKLINWTRDKRLINRSTSTATTTAVIIPHGDPAVIPRSGAFALTSRGAFKCVVEKFREFTKAEVAVYSGCIDFPGAN